MCYDTVPNVNAEMLERSLEAQGSPAGNPDEDRPHEAGRNFGGLPPGRSRRRHCAFGLGSTPGKVYWGRQVSAT
jgi:hypothetical protein